MVSESMTTRDMAPFSASLPIFSILSVCSSRPCTWNTRRFLTASSSPEKTCPSLS